MIKRTLLRHILPVALSTMCVCVFWVAGTLPMVAMVLIDGDFALSEYMQFLLYALGVAFGLSVVVLFPLALLGEVLVRRNKHAIWIFPTSLCLCTGVVLVVRIVVLKSLLDAILGWSGYVAIVSVVFGLYWVVLWAEDAALRWWRGFRERRVDGRSCT